MTQLFLSEFVCGGGWADGHPPASLLREGLAMWRSAVEDFARLPAVDVLTTWDTRHGPPPRFEKDSSRVTVVPVPGPAAEAEVFSELVDAASRTLVIAPETDGVLLRRCAAVPEARRLNAGPVTISLATDKWDFFQAARALAAPVIPTQIGDAVISSQGELREDAVDALRRGSRGAGVSTSGWVVKPRDGCGSQEIRVCATLAELQCEIMSRDSARTIVQPLLSGTPASVIACFVLGALCWVSPVGQQRLSGNGRFEYQGGVIAAADQSAAVEALIAATATLFPDAQGLIGYDLLLPGGGGPPILVEVNPRWTTSWLGYRRLSIDALAQWWINPGQRPAPRWAGRVAFTSSGEILEQPACTSWDSILEAPI